MTIYIFIPVSGCVGRGPSALLFPGAYDTVKTALVCTMLFIVFFILLIYFINYLSVLGAVVIVIVW